MLQWTGGSRKKVATSRKSTHSRQKQFFEQRKRQRQTPGQENYADGREKIDLCNAEPRSLDILNLINLTATSQRGTAELSASMNSGIVKISDDSLLRKITGKFSKIEAKRLDQVANSSDSNQLQASQTDSYKCSGNVSKWKMPGSIQEHAYSWKNDTLNEKEKPQIEATVLDLLGDDGLCTNGRRIPETHVALSVKGLGKIGSQTPVLSPRMHNRFSCKGISTAPKASSKVRSMSALEWTYQGCNEEPDSMGDELRLSPAPLCNNGRPCAYAGVKVMQSKTQVAPMPLFSHEDQVEKISIKGKDFNKCLFASDENLSNDSFEYLEDQVIEEGNDAVPHNQRFSSVGYPFLNSSTRKFEKYLTTDVGVRDTVLGSSRKLWEGGELFEPPAAAHFRHSTSKTDGISFKWGSDGSNADKKFDSLSWSSLEDSQDSIAFLSQDLNLSTAARNKSSFNLGKGKTNCSDKFPMLGGERSLIGSFSEDENMFSEFDVEAWDTKQREKFSFRMTNAGNIFHEDSFDLCPPPKSSFKPPEHEMFTKQPAFESNFPMPMKPSKIEGSSTHLPKFHDFDEDRGSSGKPQQQPKEQEIRPVSSGNAESAAGEAETLSKDSEQEESKGKIPEAFDGQRVENSKVQAEEIPLEELNTQIQNYVHNKLNQLRGCSPFTSHPSNEESKEKYEAEAKKCQNGCGGGNGDDASYQVMLQSYVFQLLCVQKVLSEASGNNDVKKA